MNETAARQTEGSGIVFDVKRYTLHDGPGIRVSIHLKGCPLACWWCHNPESQSYSPQLLFREDRCIACNACVAACPNGAVSVESGALVTDPAACTGTGVCADVCPSGAREICGRRMRVSQVMEQILKERLFFEQSGGGVTLTGGEPLGQPEFAKGILQACKASELHTAVDTCGFVGRSVLMDVLPYTDLFLYDLKHMDPEMHRKYTGVDNAVILDNLLALGEAGAAIWARIPFIPGINTDEKNIRATGEFLRGVKGVRQVHLLPYHNAAEDKHGRWNMPYKLEGVYAPTEHALRAAAKLLESYGVPTVVGG